MSKAGTSGQDFGAEASRPAAESAELGIVDQLWRLFSSTRLALGLILAIAGLSLLGILVVQAPADLAPGSPEHAIWLQRVRPLYGAWTEVLAALQLFSVANSLWMRLLLGALAVSILVCTLDRWPRIWRSVFRPSIRGDDAIFQTAGFRQELTLDRVEVDQLVAALRSALSRRRYRVLVESGPTTYLYADRYRFGRLGTLLNHLAIILVLVGTVASSVWGLRNPDFVVPEGSTRAVGFGTGLTVKVEAFADEYYPEGPPKDYRSDLVIYHDGVEVRRGTVRVNEPLGYGGVRFHQSFFGPAVVVQIRDEAGRVIFDDGVPLALNMRGRPMGYLVLPDRKVVGYVVAPASRPGDPSLSAGQLRLDVFDESNRVVVGSAVLEQGTPRRVGELTYTFVRERQFTGLQVVKDPGAPVIWVACALMVAGMAAALYFPHRRCWARCEARADGQAYVSLAGLTGRDSGFERELGQLVRELESLARMDVGEAARDGRGSDPSGAGL